MKRLATTLLLLSSSLLYAACGGDDGAGVTPDAEEEASIDAGLDPDADNSCTTDAPCVGADAGDVLCSGNSVVTCVANGDCLDASAVSCGVDACVDDGSAACEALAGDGESCATAQVITADTTIAGTDFAADFANDHDFTDPSCDDADPATTSAEAVYSVALAAGQRITVTNTGGIDTVMGVQQTCGDANACLVAGDDPDSITYTAAAATTVFVYVGSYAAAPDPADYSLEFAFTACGDGTIDAEEECDDGDADSLDGCSSACVLEFGFDCTNAEPTVCTALPDLGTFAGGATITATSTDPLAAGTSVIYTVTFTVPVRVTGTLTATGGVGDVDWYASTPLVLDLYVENATGDETIGDQRERYFTAGTYSFEINAYEALDGYTLSLTTVAPTHADLGTFAAASAISNVVQTTGLAAGASDYYTITFSDAVLLDGTLTRTTTGDMNLYWWSAGEPTFASTNATAPGDESFTDVALPAGTYYVRPNALFSGAAVDGYTLALSTTAP